MTDLSAYGGRWVAIKGADVIADGDTAEETYRAALKSDPGEHFYLSLIEDPTSYELPFTGLLDEARSFLTDQAIPVYIVGGAVRDALLGRANHDLDFVVPHDAIALTFKIADAIGAPAYVLDAERETGRIVLPATETMLDFACYRGPDLFADLRERDFTINSLALPAAARSRAAIIDPGGGLADLANGRIRLTHPGALASDPVRALRAVRLAAQLGYTITPETESAVMDAAARLKDVSAERVRDELMKIMRVQAPAEAVEAMYKLGLLTEVLPEVAALATVPQSKPHHEPALPHSISVLRWLVRLEHALFSAQTPEEPFLAAARSVLSEYLAVLGAHQARAVDGGMDGRLVLRLAALLHDVGKQTTMEIGEDGRYRFYGHADAGVALTAPRLRKLAFSKDAIAQISVIVAEHMRPLMLVQAQGMNLSRRAAYRYFKAAGANGLDVALLSLADHLATYDGPGEGKLWDDLQGLTSALLRTYFEQHDEMVKPPVLVNGRDLIEHLQLEPGPEIGRILSLIEEYQAAGELKTREEALLFAERLED